MQFSDYYKKWHKETNNVALLVALIATFLEISVSIIMIIFTPDMIELSIPRYILFYTLLPSITYFSLVFWGRFIINSKKKTDASKNFFSILILTLQFFIIAYVHNKFVFTIILFIVPIMLTFIYSDKNLTNKITFISIVLMILSSLGAMNTRTNSIFQAIETFIALILLLGCNLLTQLTIKFEKDKNDIIKSSIFKQMQLEELIKCDPLTGLYNIVYFYKSLDAYMKSDERPLSLAVVDIDDFKLVNDTWGHEKANEVLIYLASQLQACCITKGYVFRYGGEEFTIIFPKTSPEQAKAMLEQAQKNIYEHDFNVTPHMPITFSCGIVSLPSSGYNAHEFFQLADRLMYQAKFTGKNKILTDKDYLTHNLK